MWNALTAETRRERAENTVNFMIEVRWEGGGVWEREMGKKRGRRGHLYETWAFSFLR